jgi:hypothetical protein
MQHNAVERKHFSPSLGYRAFGLNRKRIRAGDKRYA